LFFPALAVINSWLKGLLINGRNTKDVNIGMGINLTVTAVILSVGLWQQWAGLATAAIALNLSSIFENIYLASRAQNLLPVGNRLFGPALSKT
ncbi:MAG: hypothetical protein ACE5EY_03480, partial [Anaerolineae bacterium]